MEELFNSLDVPASLHEVFEEPRCYQPCPIVWVWAIHGAILADGYKRLHLISAWLLCGCSPEVFAWPAHALRWMSSTIDKRYIDGGCTGPSGLLSFHHGA